jgi:hypothetical protein
MFSFLAHHMLVSARVLPVLRLVKAPARQAEASTGFGPFTLVFPCTRVAFPTMLVVEAIYSMGARFMKEGACIGRGPQTGAPAEAEIRAMAL